jgi:hypothetical protein
VIRNVPVRREDDRRTPADDHQTLIDRIDRTIDALLCERTRLGKALARLEATADPKTGHRVDDRER